MEGVRFSCHCVYVYKGALSSNRIVAMIYRIMLVIGLACSGFGYAATDDLLYPEAPPFERTTHRSSKF